MRKILTSAVLLSSLVAFAPADAQRYGYGNGFGGGIERQLDQIVTRIRRAEDRGAISRREESRLLLEARQIRQLRNVYARNGLSRWEVRDLESRLQRLRQHVRFERLDGNGRRF